MAKRNLAKELQGLVGFYTEPITTSLLANDGDEPFGRGLFPFGEE